MLFGSVLFAAAVLVITPFIGSERLALEDVWNGILRESNTASLIFLKIRMPRILLGFLTGGTLAVSGVVFQALLRNPLATPYTLGVSSGSALGALIVIKTGIVFSWWGFTATQIAAFTGSLATIILVYWLAKVSHRKSIFAMILSGVTLGYFFSALILILHYISDFTETHQMIRWTIGGVDVTGYDALKQTTPVLLTCFVVIWLMAKPLNLISASSEMAFAKGVNVVAVQKWLFLLASLMTGTVVALSGPIGFVGLIVPHALRIVGGADHRYLLPSAMFFGGAFLAAADTMARTILAPIDIPVGIITTLLGGPFFLWLLTRKR
jgi:iron complex transport system permease protein